MEKQHTGPLRVCLVIPYDLSPQGGGVKQHVLHLAAALKRRGDDVTIIGPSSAPIDVPGIHSFGGVVNIPGNGSDNMLGLFVSPLKVWQFFHKQAFDVIHLHEPHSPLLTYWTSWITPKTPKVATFHAYSEKVYAPTIRRMCDAIISPWLQRGIAVSPWAARHVQSVWKRPLTIIPNGVSTKIFTPSTDAEPSPDSPTRLLFVGRLADKRKGARYLWEAYGRLRERGVNVTLDVVGELGSAQPPPSLDGLTYHGDVDVSTLADRYRHCDVFVAPSTGQESFGIILLEAMASGKPVICSNIDGYRSVINPQGALFSQPCDAADLEKAIDTFAHLAPEQRRAMSEANLRRVQDFDWDNIVHRIREEYFEAMRLAGRLN
jgi:phosphatidyl-myo-inositol alpha-mannosyltransferase